MVCAGCVCAHARRSCVLAAHACPPPPLSILRRPRPIWWSALVLHNAATAVEKTILSKGEWAAATRPYFFAKSMQKYFPPHHTPLNEELKELVHCCTHLVIHEFTRETHFIQDYRFIHLHMYSFMNWAFQTSMCIIRFDLQYQSIKTIYLFICTCIHSWIGHFKQIYLLSDFIYNIIP